MNRRALLASLVPLMGVLPPAMPNPSASCAEPFSRMRDPVDPERLTEDLLLWQHRNPHVRTAYVLLNHDQRALTPPGGTTLIGRTRFHFRVPEAGIPPDGLWGIMADCGQLL